MDPKRFAVVNLGCKVNKVEADAVAAALSARGWRVADQGDADLIVVNTCTVTAEADKKARKAVRHALSSNGFARVVVTGCASALQPGVFESMSGRVEVIDRGRLIAELREGHEDALRYGEGFRTRVSLKVQDGCDHACTYCIVHVARGKASSVPLGDVVAEARAYFERGVKEVVLAGIDLGSYRCGEGGLAVLLDELVEQADKACACGQLAARIRISSIEPMSLDSRIVDRIAAYGGRVCRHLHLPLQSGSSKVLSEMARPYDGATYRGIVDELRSAVPSISLTTDIICGFPGETDDDFEQTLSLARACAFSKIHVFPYSRREGTPAARRVDQVDSSVKTQRARKLRELSDELRRSDFAGRVSTSELVLVEDARALTESYHEVAAPAGTRPGDLVRMTICASSAMDPRLVEYAHEQ